MKKIWINFILAGALCAPSLYADSTQGNVYYKYKDKDGNTIISSTLPPEVANTGYQVISPLGNTVKNVAPRKTTEEISQDALEQEKQASIRREQEKIKEAAAVQAHKDEILLQSFSSEADIERARNDKLSSIQVLEEIIRENMIGLEKQLKDAKAAMIDYQRKGQKAPETIDKTISESERQIKENKAFLSRKEIEKKEIYIKYQSLTERFKALQNKNSAPMNFPVSTESKPTDVKK